MNEAINQINAEIDRLRAQISTLEKARDLLAGIGKPSVIEPVQRAAFVPTAETKPKANVAAATRWAIAQMRGQFLTGDVIANVKKQGYTSRNNAVSVSAEIKLLAQSGFLTCVTKRRGIGGNTWIKTAELEAQTNPSGQLKGGL